MQFSGNNLFLKLITLCIMTVSCDNSPSNKISTPINEEALYRPNFHFTPKANWMNDPNGMFFLNGTYHLFFQYYPDGNVWGPMHWGHATSKDMVKWEEQEIALYPDELGYIFSGSAVVDHKNTSGFGDEGQIPVVAIFTYHDPKGEKSEEIDFQTQGIAYSLDEGKTWTKYEGNPVIPNPGIKDFRDPKVIWDESNEQWLMALATYEETLLYVSKNLIEWEKASSFGKGIGAHGGVWECPDFFPMKIEGTDEEKWVLLQSLNPGASNGGSGTQYFIGDFDGTNFKLDATFQKQVANSNAVWLDYGRDNYAGVTWSNIPDKDGRKLFIGWMSNWDYAQEVPTTTWRSAMTTSRELKLCKTANGYQLKSVPVNEYSNYSKKLASKNQMNTTSKHEIYAAKSGINKHHLQLTFHEKKGKHKIILTNETENVNVSFDFDNATINVDRNQLKRNSFSEKFASKPSTAPLIFDSDKPVIDIYIDKTSLEIFCNKGEVVMTELFFASEPITKLLMESSTNVEVDYEISVLNL